MIDIEKKIIGEIKNKIERYLLGKTWRIVIYGKHRAILGRSDPFKFGRRKFGFQAPPLTIPIKKTAYATSVFMVSSKWRWDLTKQITRENRVQVYGTEFTINGLIIRYR